MFVVFGDIILFVVFVKLHSIRSLSEQKLCIDEETSVFFSAIRHRAEFTTFFRCLDHAPALEHTVPPSANISSGTNHCSNIEYVAVSLRATFCS